ncbi:MAG TPA: universal stress protein [Pirellulales bacterium]|nr:universal stress protein [Pirellulales bacterium]
MKVLVGVDGSAGGFAAVRLAGRVIDPARDQIALYYTPPQIHSRDAGPEICERARTALAEAIFAEARADLPDGLADGAETILGTQNPREGLLAAAEESRAGLIVVGARGAGRIEKLVLGSVSGSLVRQAHVPVLVVRPSEASPAQAPLRVLLAFDGSPDGHRAVRFAASLHWPTDTSVVAAGVIESLLAGAVPTWLEEKARSADAEAMAQAWVREHEADREHKNEELHQLCQALPGVFASAKCLVAEGHPAEQILRLITAERINIVVVGAHGMGAAERLLIGSTAEKVLSMAPCSVLVVRS